MCTLAKGSALLLSASSSCCMFSMHLCIAPPQHPAYLLVRASGPISKAACASCWPAQTHACAQVWLIAQDQYGNTQPSATGLNLTTAADVAAPALLDGTRPAQVGLCRLGLGVLHWSCIVIDLVSRFGAPK